LILPLSRILRTLAILAKPKALFSVDCNPGEARSDIEIVSFPQPE